MAENLIVNTSSLKDFLRVSCDDERVVCGESEGTDFGSAEVLKLPLSKSYDGLRLQIWIREKKLKMEFLDGIQKRYVRELTLGDEGITVISNPPKVNDLVSSYATLADYVESFVRGKITELPRNYPVKPE